MLLAIACLDHSEAPAGSKPALPVTAVMLLTVKTVLDPETGLSTGELAGDAARVDPSLTTSEQVAAAVNTDPSSIWAKYLQGGFEEVNSKRFAVSNAQKVSEAGDACVNAARSTSAPSISSPCGCFSLLLL